MQMTPKSKPQLTSKKIDAIIASKKIDRKKYPLVIVGIRGYYMDTMGVKGKNDRRINDDALFVRSPSLFASFNGNTDPSGYRKGKGFGSGKGMACLKAGVWLYQVGTHKGQWPALRQAAPVTVVRDGDPPYDHTGMHTINHHWQRAGSTSSAGCQTLPGTRTTGQYAAYIGCILGESKRYGQKVIPYILIENDGSIA